jgi:pimeloyl-ACP methyl ester carboxylesterase
MTTVRLHDIDLEYDERGDGPPLLLLHGFTGAGSDFRHLFDLDELARRYRLVVPDLRAHGRSNDPDDRFSFHQCARDVAALLDHLGIAETRAVGLSLGGNTLLHLASDAPARVTAMVVCSATPYIPREAQTVMRNTKAADPKVRRLLDRMADDVDDLAFTPPRLGRITARTLVVNGDRDPLYPIELSLALYRGIPNAALWVLPNAGHVPVFADDRAAFVANTLRFLES